MKCQICKRTLTNPESIADGVGPECAGKYATGVAAAGSSVARVEALAGLNDAGVNRWVVVAKLAIGAGRLGEARRFIAAAERLAQTPAPLPAPVPKSSDWRDKAIINRRDGNALILDGWAV